MQAQSVAVLLLVTVFVLLAVAAGRLAAGLFVAASRPRAGGPGAKDKI
jgi:hypothetical protein